MSCKQIGSTVWVHRIWTRIFSADMAAYIYDWEKKRKSVARFIGLGFTGAASEFNNVIRKFTAVL